MFWNDPCSNIFSILWEVSWYGKIISILRYLTDIKKCMDNEIRLSFLLSKSEYLGYDFESVMFKIHNVV